MRIIFRASLYALVLFPAFLALGPAPALAGTTTLVTYYPAPNGNYSKVTLYPQTQPSGVCRSGAMYVDNTTGAFNYCVDSNINPNGGGLIGGTLAGTGAWGNLQTVNPVHYYDVANKGYVDAASGGTPGGWTCTLRTSGVITSYTANAICQGNEKVITGACSGLPSSSGTISTSSTPAIIGGQPAWSCNWMDSSGSCCPTISAVAYCCK